MLTLRNNNNPILSNPFHQQDLTKSAVISGTGAISEAADTPIQNFLAKELKLELSDRQQQSMVSALTKPEAWLKTRKIQMVKILNELAPVYQAAITKYSEVYPMDEALAHANDEIKVLYDIKIKHLELEHPGGSVLMQNKVFENQIAVDKGKILNKNVTLPIDHEAYKEYRRQRKASKFVKQQSQITS